jgi:inner membrane protein
MVERMAGFGHFAVGMAAGTMWTGGRGGKATAWAMAGFSALAMWPDVDVIGFALGVKYAAPFGHRGATHSLVAAVLAAVIVTLVAFGRTERRWRLLGFALAVAVSHPLLDACTTGGLGVALLWPFSTARYFAPSVLRVIPVAPIAFGMLSERGLRVTLIEVVEFAPLWLVALLWRRATPTPPPTAPPAPHRTTTS